MGFLWIIILVIDFLLWASGWAWATERHGMSIGLGVLWLACGLGIRKLLED